MMLACTRCNATQSLPAHCGKPMTVQPVGGRDMLACWMGPDCGKREIPEHCGAPMSVRA